MNRCSPFWLAVLIAVFSCHLSSTAAAAAPTHMQDTARHLYDRVMEEFKRRDYEAALAGFRFFLELHGQSALAANAQYWAGECHYRLGHYKEALTAFYNVVSYYPLSPKLAGSTLKIGKIYTKLHDDEKARMMYERVLTQFPDSQEASLARTALEAAGPRVDSPPQTIEDAPAGEAGPPSGENYSASASDKSCSSC